MVYVFIDTNIYLNFYKFSQETSNKLEELKKLVESKKITLLINQQVKDEFYKNRDKVLSDLLSQIQVALNIPKISSCPYKNDTFKEIVSSYDELKKLKEKYVLELKKDIEEENLKVDKLINFLFSKANNIELNKKIITSSKERMLRRLPPGKSDSHGDAIHWETLMTLKFDQDLHLISNDGDFKSPLNKNKLNKVLENEFKKISDKTCFIHSKITEFILTFDSISKIKEEDLKEEELINDVYNLNLSSLNNISTTISDSLNHFSGIGSALQAQRDAFSSLNNLGGNLKSVLEAQQDAFSSLNNLGNLRLALEAQQNALSPLDNLGSFKINPEVQNDDLKSSEKEDSDN